MDPLSITASPIAVGGALGTSVKVLQKVASLHHAESELLSLQDEVNSLQIFLELVNDAFRDSTYFQLPLETRARLEAIKSTLESSVRELESLSYSKPQRFKVPSKNDTPKVARLAWMRLGKDVASLQHKIRDARLNLVVVLSILNLQSNIRIPSTIENVSLRIQGGIRIEDSQVSGSGSRHLHSIKDQWQAAT